MKPTTERLDKRYSDPDAAAVPWADTEARMAAAEVAWIVTVRPDGRPHTTPMVPVADGGKVYFHTGAAEVKHANIMANPHVLVLAGDTAWDKGLDVVVEGSAVPVTDETLLRHVADLYLRRWDGRWKIPIKDGAPVSDVPGVELVVYEIVPDKAYGHAKNTPFGMTTYDF